MTAPLVFIDTETTGLDPERHEVWEVAIVRRDVDGGEAERVWQLPVDLGRADPIALNIGRFHERRWKPTTGGLGRDGYVPDRLHAGGADPRYVNANDMSEWARRFVDLTRGAHLVGAVVSFDAERLWRLLRRHGECPMWHYHLIDVEALAVGWLAAGGATGRVVHDSLRHVDPPWDSAEVSKACGVDPGRYEKHTALGDARWARDLYDAVMGRRVVRSADAQDVAPAMSDGSEPFGWSPDSESAGPGGQS